MLNSNELDPAFDRDSRLISYTMILLSAPAYERVIETNLTVAIKSICKSELSGALIYPLDQEQEYIALLCNPDIIPLFSKVYS